MFAIHLPPKEVGVFLLILDKSTILPSVQDHLISLVALLIWATFHYYVVIKNTQNMYVILNSGGKYHPNSSSSNPVNNDHHKNTVQFVHHIMHHISIRDHNYHICTIYHLPFITLFNFFNN